MNVLVTAATNEDATTEITDAIRAKIKAQVEEVRAEGREAELIVLSTHAAPAHVIAALDEELHADAIVCGTRGLGVFSGALLGSVAQRLPHVAPCTVATVPERTRSTTATETLTSANHRQ